MNDSSREYEFTYKLIRRLLVGHSISWKYLPIACWVTVFPLHFSDYSRIHESIGKKRLITTGCISRGNSRLKTYRIHKTYSLSHYIVEWKEIEMAWPSFTISLSYLYRPFWYTDRTALSFSLRLWFLIFLISFGSCFPVPIAYVLFNVSGLTRHTSTRSLFRPASTSFEQFDHFTYAATSQRYASRGSSDNFVICDGSLGNPCISGVMQIDITHGSIHMFSIFDRFQLKGQYETTRLPQLRSSS